MQNQNVHISEDSMISNKGIIPSSRGRSEGAGHKVCLLEPPHHQIAFLSRRACRMLPDLVCACPSTPQAGIAAKSSRCHVAPRITDDKLLPARTTGCIDECRLPESGSGGEADGMEVTSPHRCSTRRKSWANICYMCQGKQVGDVKGQ